MDRLKPSEIYYSQSSIFCRFRRSSKYIGETFDELYRGDIKIDDIPTIAVTKKPDDEKWYTLDNRRLWVFHHLQGANKCYDIPVYKVEYSSGYEGKFTSTNGGVSVVVNGDPGGQYWKTVTPVKLA